MIIKDKIAFVVKTGRCANGSQLDQGTVRHAMLKVDYVWGSKQKAFCGTEPGRRSVGFVADENATEITCKVCSNIVERMEQMRYSGYLDLAAKVVPQIKSIPNLSKPEVLKLMASELFKRGDCTSILARKTRIHLVHLDETGTHGFEI